MYIITNVKLPIVKIKKWGLSNICGFISLLAIILTFVSIFYFEALTLYFLGIMMASSVMAALVKNYTIVGHCALTTNELIVEDTNGLNRYLLKELENIRITITEYQWEMRGPKSVLPVQGITNYIRFVSNGKKLELEVLIKEEMLAELDAMFMYWKNDQLNFRVCGRLGKHADAMS